jgi:hypothetical protein
MTLPTRLYLQDCFIYDPTTGDLHWKTRPQHHFSSDRSWNIFNTQFAGKKIGGFDGEYLSASISGYSTRRAHRIIWKMLFDEEPSHIDHIDGCRTNNKLSNLRKATPTINSRNRLPSKHRKLPQGVSASNHNSFIARITIAGKSKHLGTFHTVEEAEKAYARARQQRDKNDVFY